MSNDNYLKMPNPSGVKIGSGYDIHKFRDLDSPFKVEGFDPSWHEDSDQDTHTKLIKSSQDFDDFLSVDAKFTGSIVGLKLSGSANFLHSRIGSSLDVHLLSKCYITTGYMQVNSDANLLETIKLDTKQDAEIFVKNYGRVCIEEVWYGGIFLYDYKFALNTFKNRQSFITALNGALNDMATFDGNLKSIISENKEKMEKEQKLYCTEIGISVSDDTSWKSVHDALLEFKGGLRKNSEQPINTHRGMPQSVELRPWHEMRAVKNIATPKALERLQQLCTPPDDIVFKKYTNVAKLQEFSWAQFDDYERRVLQFGVQGSSEKKKQARQHLIVSITELDKVAAWEKMQDKETALKLIRSSLDKVNSSIKLINILHEKIAPPSHTTGQVVGDETWARLPRLTAKLAASKKDNLDTKANKKADKLKKAYGDGVCVEVKVLNLSGTWLKYIGHKNNSGSLGEASIGYPDVIFPGQAGVFLMEHPHGSALGVVGAAAFEMSGYEDDGVTIRKLYIYIGWNRDWSDTLGICSGVSVEVLGDKKSDTDFNTFSDNQDDVYRLYNEWTGWNIKASGNITDKPSAVLTVSINPK